MESFISSFPIDRLAVRIEDMHLIGINVELKQKGFFLSPGFQALSPLSVLLPTLSLLKRLLNLKK